MSETLEGEADMSNLRHMLGIGSHIKKRQWGYRNLFCARWRGYTEHGTAGRSGTGSERATFSGDPFLPCHGSWVRGCGVEALSDTEGDEIISNQTWLLLCVVAALLKTAGRQMRKAGLAEWTTRKTAPLRNALLHFKNAHPNIFIYQ